MISLKPLFQDRSFAYKFTLLTTIPVILVALCIAIIASSRLEISVTDATFVRVKRNTYLAALSMSNQYVVYNKTLLDSFVDSLSQEIDINYAFVVDYNDGRILAHSDHSKDGEYYKAPLSKRLQVKGAGTDGITSLPGIGYEAVSPIRMGDDLFGTIRVGFSLNSVAKEIKLLRLIIAAATFFAVILSIFLSLLLARFFSKPLLALSNQAKEVSEGNFDQDITYESKDVVGKLSKTFKKMTDELKDRISEIESSERKFKGLFEASNDAVIILDNDLIIDCNHRTLEVLKGKRDEIINNSLIDFLPKFQEGVINSKDTLLKKIKETVFGRRHRFELKLDCVDKEEMDAEISLSPAIVADKTMILAVIQDITERKKAEAEIENLNLTLEKRVEERTRELSNTQDAMLNLVEDLNSSKEKLEKINIALKESEKKADLANRAKSEFLANMSHEIRTPLNAIVGLTYLTKQTELSPVQHEYLLKIDSSAETLLTVINDILDFSKIEAGKLAMESSEFYLEEVLNKVADMVSMKADEKGLELIFTSDGKTPNELIGDPLRLGQVLLNLVGNAIKFTRHGEVVIKTRLLGKNEDKVKIGFEVKDTGIGISAEQKEKLFKAFSQADTSTSRKFGGTGLGLVICKRIIEMMGGDIEFESEPGKGSIFSFTAHFGTHENIRPWPMVFADDFKGKRALVIDDSKTARQALKRILESIKLDVTLAASGKEALNILEKNRDNSFDMVFTDLKMPLMDGLETAKNIKNNKTLSNLPVIIMVTAFGRDDVFQQAQEIGLDGFITKPVSPSTILDSIMTAFGKKNGTLKGAGIDRPRLERGLGGISGAKILLAEDNEVNQQVAMELLDSVGMDVTLAENGKQVLELLDKDFFDCILMDVQMPVMDGLTTTRKIRSLNTPVKEIPIIALTAHAMSGDREKSLESGMNDHITKPLDPEELFKSLVKWIKPIPGKAGKKVLIKDFSKQDEKSLNLPELPGIDTVSALARVGGNIDVYKKILKKFPKGHLNAVDEIAEFIKNGDLQKAREAVHALKGVSGNIGAKELHKTLSDFETKIKENSYDEFDEMISFSKSYLKEVLTSVEKFNSLFMVDENKQSSTDNSDKIDIKEIEKTISNFKKLLQKKSFGSTKEFEKLSSLLKGSVFNDQVSDLKNHVERYRFKDALNLVDELEQAVKSRGDNND